MTRRARGVHLPQWYAALVPNSSVRLAAKIAAPTCAATPRLNVTSATPAGIDTRHAIWCSRPRRSGCRISGSLTMRSCVNRSRPPLSALRAGPLGPCSWSHSLLGGIPASRLARSRLDHDESFLRHLAYRVARTLARVATVAHTAVWHLVRAPRGDLVDQDSAEVELVCRAQRRLEIRRVDRGLQAVAGVVRETDRVADVVVPRDTDDRAEHLVRAHLHLGRDVDEHGRLEHAVAHVTAREHGGAAGHGVVDPRLHTVAVARRDQRGHVRLLVERVADAQRLHERDERAEEVVRDGAVHEDALGRDARLSRVREPRDRDLARGRLVVGPRLDDDGRVVAQLEADLLARRALLDAPADLG